ncbi:Holliday junction branch migration protein RuvA [Candidatus Saccharibacteria bacterium]|nr:Holliday junction branch migration protein RuvA [Candidatus Saccharibacteria bacterium]
MIAHIEGVIAEKFLNSVIVDVHGVGYELTLTSIDFDAVSLGETHKFYTYHQVREQSEDLYGFSTLAAKKLFEMLISVNGVGPKAAISILSLAVPEEVRNAIANADSTFVSKAAGVGKKSAERVIVDLRDKVGIPSHYGSVVPATKALPPDDDALDALIALGLPLKDATAALDGVDANLPTAERVRLALKNR